MMVYFSGHILTVFLLISGKGILGSEKCGNYKCPSYTAPFEVRNYQDSWWLVLRVKTPLNSTIEDALGQNWEQIKEYLSANGYPLTSPLYACVPINAAGKVDLGPLVFEVMLENYRELKLPADMIIHHRVQPNIIYVRTVPYTEVACHECKQKSVHQFIGDVKDSGLQINRVCLGYQNPDNPPQGPVDLKSFID